MTDEQLLLANAFIDGELDAHQRAVAEADPVVMREVAALQDMRAKLRDVAPPSAATRADAIAAALNAWSPQVDSDASVTRIGASQLTKGQLRKPADRTAAERSRWRTSTRLLGAAAAVIGLGMAGMVLTVGRGPSSGDTASRSLGSDDGAGARSSKTRSAPQSDSVTAGSDEVLDEAMMERSGGAMEYATSEALSDSDVAVVAAPGVLPDLVVVPMPTLQFTELDLSTAVDQLTAAPLDTTQDLTGAADSALSTSGCAVLSSPDVRILGEETASNSDPLRPTVQLAIVTDATAETAYAIDAMTCQVVQATPLVP